MLRPGLGTQLKPATHSSLMTLPAVVIVSATRIGLFGSAH